MIGDNAHHIRNVVHRSDAESIWTDGDMHRMVASCAVSFPMTHYGFASEWSHVLLAFFTQYCSSFLVTYLSVIRSLSVQC
jgi:hypothetical protein